MNGPAPEGLDPATFRERLRSVYRELNEDVARLAPRCEISGRCCRFEEYGHTLFASAPEVALLLADAPPPCRPLDEGATCPWQDSKGRCTARDARPLGCRVYFCDPAYQSALPEIGEASIARLKRLVDDLGLPWDYAPLHRHLRTALDQGRFAPPAVEDEPRRPADDR